jgi:hypothetical protein
MSDGTRRQRAADMALKLLEMMNLDDDDDEGEDDEEENH